MDENKIVQAWEAATREERVFFPEWLKLRVMKNGAFIGEARHAQVAYHTIADGNSEESAARYEAAIFEAKRRGIYRQVFGGGEGGD